MKKIGLSLSGGGAKGAAHIGVLKALEEEGIDISYISGTSSGSIIASLFACGYKSDEIKNIFISNCYKIGQIDRRVPFKFIKSLFTQKIYIKGFSNGNYLENMMYKYFFKKNVESISETKIPLGIPVVDLKSEKLIYYTTNKVKESIIDENVEYKNFGRLATICRGSASFPGIFIPRKYDEFLFVDGGVSMNTPVSILKSMGAEYIISVSFENITKFNENNYNILSVTLKSFEIMGKNISKDEINLADQKIIIKLPNAYLLDCSKSEYYINMGYIATKKVIEKIKNEII